MMERYNRDGKKNGHWKGGTIIRFDGYILVRKGIIARGSKGARYKLLHRIVMEEYLGRPLLRAEVVHHKNHDKGDNRIENLEIITQSEHAAKHHVLRKRNNKGQYQ